MSPRQARTIIASLINASYTGALVSNQDGGIKVDVAWSIDHPGQVMSTQEAERIMDAAIEKAWEAMTGKELIVEDPVGFVLDDDAYLAANCARRPKVKRALK